jgi:hypothetical protein
VRFGGRVWLVSSPIACRPRWLGPVASFGAVSGRRSPSSASARSRRTRLFRLRLGVLARDRRVLPKQSAEPGTAGGPFEATPARPFSPPPGSAAHAAPNRGPDEASPGQAPLMRFRPLQHMLAATRCPGQPASGRSRFDVSASRGPRLDRDLHLALVRAVFRRAEPMRWCSRVADACEGSVPVESVACALASPRRRLDGLLLRISFACDRSCECDRRIRLRHAHDRSNHLERLRYDSAARAGSSRRRCSSRGVPLPAARALAA